MKLNVGQVQAHKQEILDSTPYQDGLPVITGGTDTYWTLIRSFTGPIRVNDKEYQIKVTKQSWKVDGIDRRNLPEDLLEVMVKLHNDFNKAYSTEKFLRAGLKQEDRVLINKEYAAKNKDKIKLHNTERTRVMLVQNAKTVNETYKQIVDGKNRNEIRDWLINNEGHTLRRANQIIAEASSQIKQLVEEERETLKEKHHMMMMELYQKNIDAGDFREARIILESIGKLYGLNEPKKVEVNTTKKILKFGFDLDVSKPAPTLPPTQIQLDEYDKYQELTGEDYEQLKLEEKNNLTSSSLLDDMTSELNKLQRMDDEDLE